MNVPTFFQFNFNSLLNSGSKSLDHFSSIGPNEMHTQHSLVLRSHTDNLDVAVIGRLFRHEKFRRFVIRVVNFYVLFSKVDDSVFLAETNASVLQRTKHSRRDIRVIHDVYGIGENSLCQHSSSYNRDWSQFWFFLQKERLLLLNSITL